MLDTAKIANLGGTMRGQLIEATDPAYEEARALYDGMIDKRPLAIARCADVTDVIAAVNFGRDNGLLIAIRGGGHNGPGLGSVDKGLVIDLSPIKGVRVDPDSRTARVGAGCTQVGALHWPSVACRWTSSCGRCFRSWRPSSRRCCATGRDQSEGKGPPRPPTFAQLYLQLLPESSRTGRVCE